MKGQLVGQFKVGDRVAYESNKGGTTGLILKLHRAGKGGTAEIKPDSGSKKVTRKLCRVGR